MAPQALFSNEQECYGMSLPSVFDAEAYDCSFSINEVEMGEFVKVAGAAEIPPGQGKAVDVGGHRVAVFNVDGSYCAIGDACTHQGAPLSDGSVSGNIVTCPWHGAKFDVTTGQALSPPASGNVVCYKARATDDGIDIEV